MKNFFSQKDDIYFIKTLQFYDIDCINDEMLKCLARSVAFPFLENLTITDTTNKISQQGLINILKTNSLPALNPDKFLSTFKKIINNEVIIYLSKAPNLRNAKSLDLSNCENISSNGWVALAKSLYTDEVKTLNLTKTKITDFDLGLFIKNKGFQNLESL